MRYSVCIDNLISGTDGVYPHLKQDRRARCTGFAKHCTRLSAGALIVLDLCLASTVAAAQTAGAPPAVPTGSVVQVVLGLAVVLALVGTGAWLLKRFTALRGTGSGLIRIVAGAAVGQRERIVLVEIGGTWLLLGVAPGQVRTLHTMPPSESAMRPDAPTPANPGFAAWLRRMTEKRAHE